MTDATQTANKTRVKPTEDTSVMSISLSISVAGILYKAVFVYSFS